MSNLLNMWNKGEEGPKLIAVMGATGAQGGSVVRAFHAAGTEEFEVRAITRNPDSEKAQAITSLVKETVQANADDEESMVQAFEGCYGAFVVTNFWEDMDMNHEMKQTKTIQAAAKKAGLKHVVLSTLPDTRELINAADNKDTWKVLLENEGFNSYVPHFDGKGAVAKDFAANVPTTRLETTFYYENFINFGMGPAKHAPDQPYAITFPMKDAKLAMISVSDIGKVVMPLFKDSGSINTTVPIASENLTCKEVADIFTKVCGYDVTYNNVPVDIYAGFGFPGAEDLANMFRYYEENEKHFIGDRNIEEIETLMGEPTHKLEDWVTENKEAFAPKKEEEETKAEASSGVEPPDSPNCCIVM